MTLITKLDVVNDCLGLLGEDPITSIDGNDHAMLPSALRAIITAGIREQSPGWWFNTEETRIVPDTLTKRLALPLDTLSVDPLDTTLPLVQRGRFLYRTENFSDVDPFQFSEPVAVRLVRHIDFEDLPAPAQLVVSVAAQILFQDNFDADSNKAARLNAEYESNVAWLRAEHARSVDANLLRTPSVQAKLADMGLPPRFHAGRLQHHR
jgi:hypothetical protein